MIFDNPPEGFNSKVSVAACFIECGNEVLFVKRAEHVTQPGTWAIPGGKVEKNETPTQAICREIQEECCLSISDPEFIHTVYIRYPDFDYIYHMFRVRFAIKPEIILDKDNAECAWLTREQADTLEAHNKLILDEMPCIKRVYGNAGFDEFVELPEQAYATNN